MQVAYYLEDAPLQQEIMLNFLEDFFQKKFYFYCFERLEDLKHAVSEQQPALVISDLEVPDARAEDTVQFLSEHVHSTVPVIVTSANQEINAKLCAESRFEIFPKGENMKRLREICNQLFY